MSGSKTSSALPPLTALRSFEAAARHGSFTRAADELYVTHGAISHQVKVLETWAGTPLFQRHGRRIKLTDAGRVFAERVGAAFEDIGAAAHALQSDREGARTLCINALPTFAMRWLLPRLARFQYRQPQVELRLVTSDVPVSQLAPLSFDVAIRRTGGSLSKGFLAAPFLTEREVPVMSPGLLQKVSVEQPKDLASLPLLAADTRRGAWDRWFAATNNGAAMEGANLQRFEHFYLALQAAVDGIGVALGPLPLVNEDIRSGRLVVPIDGPYLSLAPYCWVRAHAMRHDPVIASFIEWLEEEGSLDEGFEN